MKQLRYILLGALFAFSCTTELETAFSVSENQLVVAADGGEQTLRVTSASEWVAIASEPWVSVSPSNGYGSVDCAIRVDSSLVSTQREAFVRFSPVGQPAQTIKIQQWGFERAIVPEFTEKSIKNTAGSALKVKEDGLKNQAGIASKKTAEIYGLKVLADAIQDNKHNSTRFIIVCGKKVYSKEANNVSICFEIPHESGSLYNMLSHFIYNNVNMTNIQSRPVADKNWEYRFFVDFEGKLTDTSVINALRGLQEETLSLRILGTY